MTRSGLGPGDGFLLDTTTVSEWVKPRPDPGVVRWFREVDEDHTYLSVITIGELRRGVERLPQGRRRAELTEWLHDQLADRFEGRILPVETAVAVAWGALTARLASEGRQIGAVDALIAATAASHRLRVVTRNVRDFAPTGVPVVSPWTGDGPAPHTAKPHR